jgi:hypothetical protein
MTVWPESTAAGQFLRIRDFTEHRMLWAKTLSSFRVEAIGNDTGTKANDLTFLAFGLRCIDNGGISEHALQLRLGKINP